VHLYLCKWKRLVSKCKDISNEIFPGSRKNPYPDLYGHPVFGASWEGWCLEQIVTAQGTTLAWPFDKARTECRTAAPGCGFGSKAESFVFTLKIHDNPIFPK
jgi:hypothetical protein